MLLEREHYQAFTTSVLCEKALNGPLVYHGRTGHLLLQGVPHVMRVRVVADLETRIKSVEDRLGITREKAKQYITQVDEDRHRWVHTFYNMDWDTSSAYDFTINLEHANVHNVAAAFCGVAKLPDFQETPFSRNALEDLLLANRCRTARASRSRRERLVLLDDGVVGMAAVAHPEDRSAWREAIAVAAEARVVLLTLRLSLPGASSLKEKRARLRPLLEGLRNRFPVSAAEVGRGNAHDRSVVAAVVVSGDGRLAESILGKAAVFAERFDVVIEEIETEVLL